MSLKVLPMIIVLAMTFVSQTNSQNTTSGNTSSKNVSSSSSNSTNVTAANTKATAARSNNIKDTSIGDTIAASNSQMVSRCHPELTKSYGLTGVVSPLKIKLGFCPQVVNSCCNYRDQMIIYENQIINGESAAIKRKFTQFAQIYIDLINALGTVSQFTGQLAPQLKRTNNCKILSTAINNFKVAELIPSLRQMVTEYFDFHSNTFQGFYCTICDADSTPFIDLTKKAVKVNVPQCRATVSQSLKFLLYSHLNFPKIVNLAVNFASNCDARGAYSNLPSNAIKYRLRVRRWIRELLTRCKANVDKGIWLNRCRKICQITSLVDFKEFFRPNLDKIKQITLFLNSQMQSIQAQVANINLQSSSVDNGTATKTTLRARRVLKEKRQHRHRAVKQRNRKAQLVKAMNVSSPLGSSAYYANQILQDLHKTFYGTVVIPVSVGAQVDLSLFQTIVDDPRTNRVDNRTALNWQSQTEKMYTKQKEPSDPVTIFPEYTPVNASGLNPLLVSQFTYINQKNLQYAAKTYVEVVKSGGNSLKLGAQPAKAVGAKSKSTQIIALQAVVVLVISTWYK